ncbi:hypothetical protein HMPREF0004_4582 [Achromobacter piechaudii ATCC 43553]|uniref:Uncharacterized protein n=1 Tax=Achromobacter piechaudii ATCC 43553 TaxID=742159 RepID=D4XGI5_9BURK|nr:hypothetical protein HMPREF0004_4582 [Achromobacter piechaudii ATCC 43553]
MSQHDPVFLAPRRACLSQPTRVFRIAASARRRRIEHNHSSRECGFFFVGRECAATQIWPDAVCASRRLQAALKILCFDLFNH